MNKTGAKGAANQAAGAIRKNAGKAVGSKKTTAKGAAQQAKGKAQSVIGGLKDTAKDARR